jgi:hypothetical protein
VLGLVGAGVIAVLMKGAATFLDSGGSEANYIKPEKMLEENCSCPRIATNPGVHARNRRT